MSFLSGLRKTKLPNVDDLSKIPKSLKTSWQNTELNTIDIRFFNTNFSKMIPTVGFINRDLAVPIVYIEKPHKAGIILLDDKTYTDVSTGKEYLDVCESYPFGLDKNIDLKFDFDAQYYNDIKENLIDKEKADILKDKTGIGYYLPVMLNNIPIPIIKYDTDVKISFLNNQKIKSITYITQALLMQMSRQKLFARTTDNDNSGMGYAFLMGFLLGGILFTLFTLYLVLG